MERIDYYCFMSPLTNSLKAGNLLWLKIFLWNNKLCFWICLLFSIVKNSYGGFEASWDPNWPGSEAVVKYAKHFILWEFLCWMIFSPGNSIKARGVDLERHVGGCSGADFREVGTFALKIRCLALMLLGCTFGIKLPGCSFGGSRTCRCHDLVAPWLLSHPGQAIIINMIVIADLKSSSSEKSRCSYLQQQRYTIDGALERSRWILISQRFKIENP